MPSPISSDLRRHPERSRFAVEDALVAAGQSAAAVRLGPGDAGETRVGRGAAGNPWHELQRGRRPRSAASRPLRGRVASRNARTSGRNCSSSTAPAAPVSLAGARWDHADCSRDCGPVVPSASNAAERHVLHHPGQTLTVDARVHRRHRTQHAVDHQDRGARFVVGQARAHLAQQVHPLGHRHSVDARQPAPGVVVE